MNTITIGGLPVYDLPEDDPRSAFTNTFQTSTGASRPGIGKFLMRRTDYATIAAAAAVKLKMTSNHGPGLELDVVVAGFNMMSESADGSNDLVEVILYDTRARLAAGPMIRAYNCALIGEYPVKYYESTTFGGTGVTAWTWAQVFTDLETNADSATLPNWTPRNLAWDNIAKGRILDDLSGRLFLVCGFDGTAVKMYDAGRMNGQNLALLAIASPCAIREGGGGAGQRNTGARSRLPGTLKITFPVVDPGTADPYAAASRVYTKDVSTGAGNSNVIQSLTIGEYIGVRSGGTIVNQSELDAVAADMGTRCVKAITAPMEDHAFAGIWPFTLDGQIRSISWISNRLGAKTIVHIGNEKDFQPTDDLWPMHQLPQNVLVGGIGEGRATMTAGGTRLVFEAVGEWVRWVKVTSSTLISGADNRYAYDWIEQEPERQGLWRDLQGGLTSADEGFASAYNSIEANNSASGVQGNSIDLDTLPGTYSILPVQGNPVVRLYRKMNCDGLMEYFFSYENATGGPPCPV